MFLNKTILATAGASALGLALFGTDAFSYVGTCCGLVTNTVKDSIPLDFEIDRARTMIKNLVPDIRSNMHLIAKEEVEVERLGKQVEEMELKLAKDKDAILRMKGDLVKADGEVRYGKRIYTVSEVKGDLANRFERFKTQDATLVSLKEMQKARERSLTGARAKLEGMLASKRQLEVDVEHLEARLKMVEAAQTTSTYQFDDSRLSRVKELVGDLRTRLTVAEKLVNADTAIGGEIPLDETTSESILDQVTEYFEKSPEPSLLAEKK
jgi:hypothetical protein